VDVFQHVLRTDPEYAPAAAGLAFAYFAMAWYGSMAPREGLPLAKAAAENALRLDAGLALGHAILGAVEAVLEWNWEEADRRFRRAIALQPSLAFAHQLQATTCFLREKCLPEAISAIERALSLNPFDAMLRATATHIYSVAGNYRAALDNYALGVEVNPKVFLLYIAMGLAHQIRGHLDKALDAFRTACDLSNRAPLPVAALGNALAQSGDRAGAEALLDEVLSTRPPNALAVAVLYVGLGEPDECLRWLDKAMADRIPYLVLVPADPRFSRLQGNARFEKFLTYLNPDTSSASTHTLSSGSHPSYG
jgi:tetratricopeptide (TPR) repeat protein